MLQSAKIYLLVLVLIVRSLEVVAQKPPTGGPNPTSPPPKLWPYIVGGSFALGGAGLYTFKLRGPKIPVRDYLPNYLLRHDILPTPDAINLMHQLNPKLNRTDVIRAKKKLVNPDFPEVPQNQANTGLNNVQTTTTLPADLKQQVSVYKNSLKTYRKTKISLKNTTKNNLNLDSINSMLTKIEKIITAHEGNKEETSVIKSQLATDLFRALNKTLSRNITSRVLSDVDSNFIKEILGNLSELILPTINKNVNPEKRGQLYLDDKPGQERGMYASADSNAVVLVHTDYKTKGLNDSLFNLAEVRVGTKSFDPPAPNLEQRFAFAIYKLDAAGKPITKGPEVEGQYQVSYTLPALRSDLGYYRVCEPPFATFAEATLPPGRYYFVVKFKGKQVALENPLIDMKEAFTNAPVEGERKKIIVPILVSQ